MIIKIIIIRNNKHLILSVKTANVTTTQFYDRKLEPLVLVYAI